MKLKKLFCAAAAAAVTCSVLVSSASAVFCVPVPREPEDWTKTIIRNLNNPWRNFNWTINIR